MKNKLTVKAANLIRALNLILLILLLTPAAAQSKTPGEEIKLPDIKKVMSAYEFKNGEFNTSNKFVSEVMVDDETTIGVIENDTIIDSSEEFVTAAFFSQVKIPKNSQSIVDKEFPKNELGAKRLCALWLKKTAEYPENRTKYMNAIAIVKEKAKEQYGAEISDESIREYYAEAMRKKIYGTPIKLLTKDEQEKVRELLLAYFIDPSEKQGLKFKDFSYSIGIYNPKKGGIIAKFVGSISSELLAKII